MTKRIPLSQGKFALVSDEDYARVAQYKWTYSQGYAVRKVYRRRDDGTYAGRNVFLHNFIMCAQGDELYDHINRDSLDNQRCNLRLATRAQNNANSGPRGNAVFKGVTYHRRDNRWIAQITSAKKRRHLGCFRTPEAAARAYDRAALELWGEFAYLNFPHT